MTDGRDMYSWIFRHRLRLRPLYAEEPEPGIENPASRTRPALTAQGTGGRPAPGQLVRRARYVILAPMPRRR